MSDTINFKEIKENTPSFRDRIEIGVRTMVQLLFPEKNEQLMIISYYMDEEKQRGMIDAVTYTSPGNGEIILRAALEFYQDHNASDKETIIEAQ